MKNKNLLKGILYTTFGASCWGISGNVGQFLTKTKGFDIEWIVTFRLLFAGLILLLHLYIKNGNTIFDIWKSKRSAWDIFLFGILGMLPTQYTYFAAIRHSNAATATVLQYTGPSIILLYLAFRNRKMPSPIEIIAVISALIGTFLLATHGNIHSLAISPMALIWGLSSAVAMAFYTIQPQRLLQSWNSNYINGWGMLLGGVILSLYKPLTSFSGTIDFTVILCLTFVLLFGTILSFSLYLTGVKYIGAARASLFASVEPLSATLVSIVWLKESFGAIDLLGFAFIIATIFILSAKPAKNAVDAPE